MATTRHLLTADADVRAGQAFRDGTIPYQRFRAWEVAGQTAGLVGLGAVARALKWRLEGLGVNVIAHRPYNVAARHSLDGLLAAADIVSLHAPVTDETTGMIGAAQFAAMRDGAVFLDAHGPSCMTLTPLSTRCAAARWRQPVSIISPANGCQPITHWRACPTSC